jgi:ADP-ribosylglycohydrolase
MKPRLLNKLFALTTDPRTHEHLARGFTFYMGTRAKIRYQGDDDPEELLDRMAGCLVGAVLGNARGGGGKSTSDIAYFLATCEGLLRAHSRQLDKGICSVVAVVWHAYRRLLWSQGLGVEHPGDFTGGEGWVSQHPLLLVLPEKEGRTSRAALEKLRIGRKDGQTVVDKPNDSKGSSAVVRGAVAGFVRWNSFELGGDIALITHGRQDAWIPAAVLARLIHGMLFEQADFGRALETAHQECRFWQGGDPTVKLLRKAALDFVAEANRREELGGGWKGNEALAQAVFSCLGYERFEQCVENATSFGGDSDTVGAIAGSIAGARSGYQALPEDWIQSVPATSIAKELAADMFLHLHCGLIDLKKYPPF